MKAFLYLIYEAGNFRPALDLCVALKSRQFGMPVMLSPYYLPDTEQFVAKAAEFGIPYLFEATALGGSADPLAQLAAFNTATLSEAAPPRRGNGNASTPWSWLRRAVALRALHSRAEEVKNWIAFYRGRLEFAARLLQAIDAGTVFLPEDNVERDSACWCRAVHARGGRAAVVSYGLVSPYEAAIAYFGQPDFTVTTAVDEWFVRIYPKWRQAYRDTMMLRLPAARALAMEVLEIAPDNPWVVNTGQIDDIVIESEFMQAQCVGHGIRRDKLRVTGTPPLDMLAQVVANADERRRSSAARWGWDAAKPIILCALPPNQYPSVRSPQHRDFAELITAWLSALKAYSHRFNLLVSPHPSIDGGLLDHLEAEGTAVVREGAAHWIPICDLYVASASSTIKWALACGKPVVNYDCYGYRHADYDGLAQVISVDAHTDFRGVLDAAVNPRRLAELTETARKQQTRFGALDGGAVARVDALLRGA